MGWEEQLGVLADTADGGGVVGQVFEHGLIGVAAIEGDEEPAGGGGRVGIEGGAQLADLLDGALAEAGGAHGEAVFLLLGGGGLFARLGGSGSVAKGDGDDAAVAFGRGQHQRSLEKALGAHEIGLKVRSERVAAPGDAGGAEAGAAHERIIEARRRRERRAAVRSPGAPHHGEDRVEGKTRLGKEPVTGGPVTKLRSRKW